MYIVTAKEMYDIDDYTIGEIGMDSKLLMENAGRAISGKVEAMVGDTQAIRILAGAGNNGGDGFVIARTLRNKGFNADVIQVVPNEKITGDALYHKQCYEKLYGNVRLLHDVGGLQDLVKHSDVVVDAMIGIGIHGALRETEASIVNMLNQSEVFVIAVDIPSGLPADEGVTDFKSVQADHTIVVGAPKVSAFLQHTASFYGTWESVEIGIPPVAFQTIGNCHVWSADQWKQTMPIRSRYAHKGDHGRGMVIGGSSEMPGALLMAIKAALRAGSGLITAGTSEKVKQMIAPACAEAMYHTISEQDGWLTNHTPVAVDHYDAIAIGIGMGRNPEAAALMQYVMEQATCPLIIDGDGLTHMKTHKETLKKRIYPTILTPHPGEMAMLLDISIATLLTSPFQYSAKFAVEYNVFVILKGVYTIITSPTGQQAVSITGNQGMAKGGSGDVLTGITLAMVMQGQSIFQALGNACYIHGKAADIAVADNHSYYDLLATDVIHHISQVYRTIS
jgi:NAD(P)H-hydrate epimerase